MWKAKSGALLRAISRLLPDGAARLQTFRLTASLSRVEELLNTRVGPLLDDDDDGGSVLSDEASESEEESDEEMDAQDTGRIPNFIQWRPGISFKDSLQYRDLQPIEMDSVSSPYSYAFRIDAFAGKVSTAKGEFQNLGSGKFMRKDDGEQMNVDTAHLDPQLANYLIDYYFRELWPLFPIIDREALYFQIRDGNPMPPASLMTAIYFSAATTLASFGPPTDVHGDTSSPSLSPRSLPPRRPPTVSDSLVENLRTLVMNNLAHLSKPILEPRITTLQTILLLCLYDRSLSGDYRSSLISDAIRISQNILLHRSINNIPARDQSLRKHLWWTIFVLEVWTAARDRTPCTIDLAEVDAPPPIESEETRHLAFTALVALTRILFEILRQIHTPLARNHEIPTQATRFRDWIMDWYCNLPSGLLVSEMNGNEMAELLLACCHSVLLLIYAPFYEEEMVRGEMERSRGIITDTLGRLGKATVKFGVISSLLGDLKRRRSV